LRKTKSGEKTKNGTNKDAKRKLELTSAKRQKKKLKKRKSSRQTETEKRIKF